MWFTACWIFAAQKDGMSALNPQRLLEIGSYQTAWAMLHRLRSVLVRPGRDRLTGKVVVDETYIGGEEPELSGSIGMAALAESVMGLFKTELHRNPAVLAENGGHWRELDALEIVTCAWVSWFNEERLHGELDDRTAEEVESEYRDNPQVIAARENQAEKSPEYLDRFKGE